jgi:hypothetical protein
MPKALSVVLLTALVFALSQCSGEDVYQVSLKYHPNKIYNLVTNARTLSVTELEGDPKDVVWALGPIASKPSKLNWDSRNKVTCTTGQADSLGAVPLSVVLDSSIQSYFIEGTDSTYTTVDPSTGTRLKGRYLPNHQLVTDEFNGKSLTDVTQSMYGDIIRLSIPATVFPEAGMRIGDSFTEEIPCSDPLRGIGDDAVMRTKLTLKAVEGNLAHFDVVVVGHMNDEEENGAMIQDISGAGTMTHDLTLDFPVSMEIESKTEFLFRIDSTTFTMTSNTSSKTVYTVTDGQP